MNNKNTTLLALSKEERKLKKKESLKRKRVSKNMYALYTLLLDIFRKKMGLDQNLMNLLDDTRNGLDTITKFMLEDRYAGGKKKVRKTKKIKKNVNPDLIVLLHGEKKKKEKMPKLSFLDIIKFFKLLENFTLKRGDLLYRIEDLELGHFQSTAFEVFDNLQRLLLSISELDSCRKKMALDYIFSTICIYRHFSVKTVPNTSTVTDEYCGENITDLIARWFNQAAISEWLKSILASWTIEIPKLTIYSGNASSPNSGASASKIIEDTMAIRDDKVLTDAIAGLSAHFHGNEEFSTLRNTLLATVTTDRRKQPFPFPPASAMFRNPEASEAVTLIQEKQNGVDLKHSRLFHFTANGGKARIIANVDWLTQTALSGIHFMLYSMLSSINSDFTFDHKAGISHVLKARDFIPKDEEYCFYSIDLSAATDRMPRLLQAELIEAVCTYVGLQGSDIKSKWLGIVDREYDTKNSKINNGLPIRYSVGQGMGLFTSWAIMALMHHFIINGICKVDTKRYCLVGDDLLFLGTKAEYMKYIHVMTSIGVSVNPLKTISSTNIEKPTIEFARNFVIEGLIINPAPFGVLFAWNDDKVSFETLVWHHLYCLEPAFLKELINAFYPNISKLEIVQLLAYIKVKCSLTNWDFSALSDLIVLPRWFTDETLEKVFAITHSPSSRRSELERDHGFMSTFVSQCVVRKEEELIITRELATAIRLLSQVTDNMVSIAEFISERLSSSDLIKYDVDLKGGPLLNKRERTLLKDLFENYN